MGFSEVLVLLSDFNIIVQHQCSQAIKTKKYQETIFNIYYFLTIHLKVILLSLPELPDY
jgi:hypothetical protein